MLLQNNTSLDTWFTYTENLSDSFMYNQRAKGIYDIVHAVLMLCLYFMEKQYSKFPQHSIILKQDNKSWKISLDNSNFKITKNDIWRKKNDATNTVFVCELACSLSFYNTYYTPALITPVLLSMSLGCNLIETEIF